MATGTFHRPGIIFLMAIDALSVKGVRAFRHFRFFDLIRISLMTIQAGTGGVSPFWGLTVANTTASIVSLFRGMMVAILAGNAIPPFPQMGLVIKKHSAGDALKHHPKRLLRCLGGHGIANDPHDKQSDCQNVCQFQFSLYHVSNVLNVSVIINAP
jgi:hypothetical protein